MAKDIVKVIAAVLAAVAVVLLVRARAEPVREPDEHSIELGIGGKR